MSPFERESEGSQPVPGWTVLATAGIVGLGLSVWNFAREVAAIGVGLAPVVAAALSAAFAGGVLYAAERLRRSDLDESERWTVAVVALGTGAFVTVGFSLTILIRIAEDRPVTEPVLPLLVMASLGILGGVVIGWERVELRRLTAAANESRDAMAFTNSILRHDVRNALQIIGGHAEALADHDDDRVAQSATAIDGQVESLDGLVGEVESVTDVLTGELERETGDLGVLLEDVLDSTVAGRVVTVERELAAHLPVEGVDALYAVFRNLVENAIRHADRDSLRIRVTARRADDSVVVRVADNGSGVPESQRDQIFERGVSADGGGHGLYVADVVVDRLGGDIRVEESDLGGAAFVVELPAADSSDGDAPSGDRKAQADGGPFDDR